LVGDDLARRASLVALLFRLEQRQSPQQLEEVVGELIGWFRQHEGFDELKRLFGELVRQAILGLGMELRVPYDLLEMKTMIARLGETWKREWFAEGEALGKTKGTAKSLVGLLVKKGRAVASMTRESVTFTSPKLMSVPIPASGLGQPSRFYP
jgi:hypothetical protein